MKLDIDGLLKGRDMGYSRSHPDTNRYIQTCSCEEPHCHLPGEDSEQRHYNACLMIAAPEMYELLANLAAVCDSWDEDYENDEQRADAFWHMARIAKVLLLTKIEGGGDNG